ncbi:bis-aminopropyl spermidine synthase family protein [Limnospira fusiformis]|uniref:bis-aminopropyl spermidine synthase family protein n=1 Tax=Limnospira fusiformis TaxID=54297 RepID=UPI00144960C0|nr:bis-aminopropyl spermidine synthase family protein [Limnospira fusiformis SAG 85.79]
MSNYLIKARLELSSRWGTEFKRIRALISCLTERQWCSVEQLIQESALSHKTVTSLLRDLEPWIDKNGNYIRFKEQFTDDARSVFDCESLFVKKIQDPYDALIIENQTLLDSITDIVREMPLSDLNLDHVSATPETCIKRALFLSYTYEIADKRILCLGDHDLTSIALSLIYPDLDITVVDIDERILDYIYNVSQQHGWSIKTAFADFRVELPRSCLASFDLVFTDPPYTSSGIDCFLRRGLAALKQDKFSRLLFCYGFGEQHPAIGLKVQSVLPQLRLVLEALLPKFNRYFGAQAIGSSSDLYICRPTKETWMTITKLPNSSSQIYTHGSSSEETTSAVLPKEILEETLKISFDLKLTDITLVGEGLKSLPFDLNSYQVEFLSLGKYFQSMYFKKGKPPFTREPHSNLVIVSLYPSYWSSLIRFFLISVAERLVIVGKYSDFHETTLANQFLRKIVESKYECNIHKMNAKGHKNLSILVADKIELSKTDALSYILRYVIDHRYAKLRNSWREALISWFSLKNIEVTKNQARQIVDKYLSSQQCPGYLSEFPMFLLTTLIANIKASISELYSTHIVD